MCTFERVRHCWDYLDWIMWLNPGKASIRTFKILERVCGNQLNLWLPKTSCIYEFPCSLHLPGTSLELSAAFFGLPFPLEYRANVQAKILILKIQAFKTATIFFRELNFNYSTSYSKIFINSTFVSKYQPLSFVVAFSSLKTIFYYGYLPLQV